MGKVCAEKIKIPRFLAPLSVISPYLHGLSHLTGALCSARRKYDLKGSTVDRDATSKELRKELPTLKDNDFVKDGMHVEIGTLAKEKLMDTLSADVAVSTPLGG